MGQDVEEFQVWRCVGLGVEEGCHSCYWIRFVGGIDQEGWIAYRFGEQGRHLLGTRLVIPRQACHESKVLLVGNGCSESTHR